MLHDDEKSRLEMAARLREAIADGPSKAAIATACNVTDQAITGWLKTGRIHKKHLPTIARLTHRRLEWLMDGSSDVNDPTPADIAPPGSRVAVWETLADLPDGGHYIQVPHYEVRLSAGDGCEWVEHAPNEPLVFRARFFQARGLKPEHCRALYVRGESMSPTLNDGDTVMIDISRREVRDDAIFAVMYHGALYIKRLFHLPGGGVELRSDNPRHPGREILGEDLDHLLVLGLKVWRAG
jgi:phage repressor protein C with HTH and peptisase S24 domain